MHKDFKMWVWDEISGEVSAVDDRHPVDTPLPEYDIEGPVLEDPTGWRMDHTIDLPDGTRIVIESDHRAHTAVMVVQPILKGVTAPSRKEKQMEDALKEAVRLAPTNVGDVLSNGATIVAIKPGERTEYVQEYIVLAVVKGGYSRYVTWRYGVGITQLATGGFGPTTPYCWSGSYHRELSDALDDYNDRVAGAAKVTV